MVRLKRALGVLLLCACNRDPQARARLIPGRETEAFARSPKPTTLHVSVRTDAGSERLYDGPFATEVTLASSSAEGILEVAADEVHGEVVLRGVTPPLNLSLAKDFSIPIFVGRAGEFARHEEELSFEVRPLHAFSLLERYVLALFERRAAIYDLTTFTLRELPEFPRPARAAAVYGGRLLLIDAAGATELDLTTAFRAEAPAPPLGSYDEVVDGETIVGKDEMWVVGPTRKKGPPTTKILRISRTGERSFVSLTSPRLGARAAYVPGLGLVVLGGGASGEIVSDALVAPRAIGATLPLGGPVAALGTRLFLFGANEDGSPSALALDATCQSVCNWERATAPPFVAELAIPLGDEIVVFGSQHNDCARITSGGVIPIANCSPGTPVLGPGALLVVFAPKMPVATFLR